MIRIFLLFSFMVISDYCYGQLPSGTQLLQKSIKYHDPGSNWKNFNVSLKIEQLNAEKEFLGTRDININIPRQSFYMKQIRGEKVVTRSIEKGKCSHTLNK